MADLLFVTDATSCVVLANDSVASLLGYTVDELRGRGIEMILAQQQPHGQKHQVHAALVGLARQDQARNLDVTFRAKSGTLIPMQVNCSVLKNQTGDVQGLVIVARDMRENRRLIEEAASAAVVARARSQELSEALDEIQAAHEELEARVKERTADLVESTSQLVRSNQDLARFAHVASHDLQEPLRAIACYSRLLERRYKGQLDSKADQYIGFMVDGALRMQALITGILEVSRIESSGKPFVEVDLAECVNGALENLRSAIGERDAEVVVDPLPRVVGDSQQLGQLLQNLISNAIKFCEQPPKVRVSAMRSGDAWTITVSDNGIGIEPEDLVRVFEPFTRLHPRSRFPGTGIGLSLCRRIAERHGSDLMAESTPGTGTRFKLTLQAVPSSPINGAGVRGDQSRRLGARV